MSSPRLLGHRGALAEAPENTLVSLRRALEAEADGFEFDVRMLGDGTAVLMHDDRVDRTTDGEGMLSAFDGDTISELDAGVRFSSEFAGERVPRLDDVLSEFLEKGLLALEMKERLADEVLDRISTVYRESLAGEMILASFDAKSVEHARDRVPAVPRALILPLDRPLPPAELVSYLGLWGVFARDESIDERYVVEGRRLGLAIWAYPVNDPDRARHLIAIGVEGIISDDPRRLRDAVPRETSPG